MNIQDGTAKFKMRDARCHHALGEIVALLVTPPAYEHLLLCDGQTIGEEYQDLIDALGTNVLPNLNGRVLQGAENAGQYVEAGLPNITGNVFSPIGGSEPKLGTPSGAFASISTTNYYSATTNTGTTTRTDGVYMDASRSNPIYGNSDTVQPPAFTVKYYICYGA